ncbi:MAG: response regulator [Tannerella sp.]|jgi:signal transduction histidine kinase/AraC-like DNA-binding protein/ligand-binding sensor domain-containing protein|nr:response regulator [Tannerella sp.]
MYRLCKYLGFLLFTLSGINQEVYSQYVFRHLNIVDGLSDNQIRNFIQIPDGRIAIRTLSNLNIYNGATFEHFYYDRRKVYPWNYTEFLTERSVFKEYCDIEERIWMKAPDHLSLFDLKSNRFEYDIDGVLKSFGVDRRIKNLFIDNSKNYWFLTEDNAFLFYDISAGKLQTVESGDSLSVGQYGIPYELAQYKNLYWIMYSSGLLRCRDGASEDFIMNDTHFAGKITEATNRLFIRPTDAGDVWIMHNNGVSFYDRTHKTWKDVASIEGPSNFFTCMDLDADGNVWVGTSWSGLRKIDSRTHQITILDGLKLENGGTLTNDIQCVFVDKDNGFWAGMLWQGLCYRHPGMKKFKLFQTMHRETPVTNESIRCFLEDEDGTILFGSLYNGVLRYHPATGKICEAFDGFLSGNLCLSLYRDSKKRLWVGTFLNGFYCIDGKNVKTYNKSTIDRNVYANQNISRAIYEDAGGRFWVSVGNQGVGELDIQTGKIAMLRDKHPQISLHKKVFNFYPVDDHTFAAYGENGIFYYDTQNDKIYIPDIDDPGNPKFASSSIGYNCILKDSRSLEWFGTEQGIRIWDKQRKQVYTIGMEDGLPNRSVVAIQEDNEGACWAASVNGVTKIEIKEQAGGYEFSFVNFDANDGLQNGTFFEKASLKSKNGDLYFGGYNGFNTFNPANIQYNPSKNRPVFTAFKLFNSTVKEGVELNKHIILENPINRTKEIQLTYKENFISFEFSGLNFVNPSRTYYRYKLENYDKGWNETATSGLGTASYTGLPPGRYKLIVYTANNDKVWCDEAAEIAIVITPPFWTTIYAYIVYILLLVAVLCRLFIYLHKRKKKKQTEREALEREKQKEELDQMKFRFFTNISHEFRTPLTLIMTPLSVLIQQSEGTIKDRLKAIYSHAGEMLELINQLLDFRKLEMGGEKLKLNRNDFVGFVEYIYSAFKDATMNRDINLTLESECPKLDIVFDKSKMQKVLNNIYANALKFTPDGGSISTIIRQTEDGGREYVTVQISDTGRGIDEKDLNSIFERFYQSSKNDPNIMGSGIGLHLVKEYVLLHEGKIGVSSKINEGSVFYVSIPIDLKGRGSKEIVEQEENAQKEPDRKTLLIVEDNEEFRRFLVEQLSGQFNMLQAGDGKQGLEIASRKYPDLIISDLMMPEMNGLELCEKIKNNLQTSHIPVILLTARLSDEAKIDSYRAGADSYISKPFNFEVLHTRIEMLIEQQEKRKRLFREAINVQPGSITTTSLDEEFIRKALQLIEKNIDNPDYSNDDLSRDLGMSRSCMYPKFQSITGQTPNHFIRSIRLKRAAQLLQTGAHTVSEISWMVGFNDIKYFNKYFKEEFGKTPTQYRNDYLK